MTRLYVFSILLIPLSALAAVRSIDPLIASLHDPVQGFGLLAFGIAIGILGVLITKGKLVQFFFCALLMSISVACFAPVIPVPNDFANGQPADADQVNANFDALATQIADHADNENLHAADLGFITLEADGSVSIKAPGASGGIYLRPGGDIEIIGNAITVSAGTNATINAGLSITADAGGNTSVTSAGDFEITGNSVSVTASTTTIIDAGQSLTTNAGGQTAVNSGGAVSIQGTTIDLN